MRLPRYVNGYKDRHGRPRYYYRRVGSDRICLPGLPWSPEFMAAYAAAHAGYRQPDAATIVACRTTGAGSINTALNLYFKNTAFTDALAPTTRTARRNLLERFGAECGDLSLKGLKQPNVQRYINTLKPSVQRTMAQALRGFLDFCIDNEHIRNNVAGDISRARHVTKGFRPWTEDDYAQFCETFPIGTTARLAVQLYINFGVRKSDVIRIGPRHIKNGKLANFLPKKGERTNGNRINIPLLPETQEIIKATALTGTETFLVTERGKPFTEDGFGNRMRQWCDQAGLPECSSHGLRKLFLTRHANVEGTDVRDLQALSGHKNLTELQVYIDTADRERRAAKAMARLEAQNQNRQSD